MSDFRAWSASAYRRHYYARVEDDEAATLAFLVDALDGEAQVAEALEFGAGPTLHHMLPLAPHAAAIDVADLLVPNLDALQDWLVNRPGAHDWRPFTRHVLACERRPTGAAQVAVREALARRRLRWLLRADAASADPLGAAGRQRYGIVVSCFCADSATADKPTWSRYMRHIAGLVAPGGLLLLAALRRCAAYRVGDQHFPSANVDEHDIAAQLRATGFDVARARIDVATVPHQRRLGYDGIVLGAARRHAEPAPFSRSAAAPAPAGRRVQATGIWNPGVERESVSSSGVISVATPSKSGVDR